MEWHIVHTQNSDLELLEMVHNKSCVSLTISFITFRLLKLHSTSNSSE